MALDVDDDLDEDNTIMENNEAMNLESLEVRMYKLILENKL